MQKEIDRLLWTLQFAKKERTMECVPRGNNCMGELARQAERKERLRPRT